MRYHQLQVHLELLEFSMLMLGQMIIYGFIFAIPIIIVGVFYAKWLGKRIHQIPTEDGTDLLRPEEGNHV